MYLLTNVLLAFLISSIFIISTDIVISEIYGIENITNISKNSLPQINSSEADGLPNTDENNSELNSSSISGNNIDSSQWVGSIKIIGELNQTAIGKIKVDMCEAGFTAEKAVGVNIDPMQSKTSVKLAVEDGYLVYRAGVIDGENNYTVIVDPVDGRILNIEPMVGIADMGMSTMYKCMDMSPNSNDQNASSGSGTMMMAH